MFGQISKWLLLRALKSKGNEWLLYLFQSVPFCPGFYYVITEFMRSLTYFAAKNYPVFESYQIKIIIMG